MAQAFPDTAVPRLVVVDDTDPTIRYSPSSAWSLDSKGTVDNAGSGGPVYNRTITGSKQNATLSYDFKGTFVRAIVAAQGVYGWDCQVDNHAISAFQVPTEQTTNYIACDSAGTLSGSTGQHTLTLNVNFGPDAPSNSTVWLDSIQYQPLSSNPLDAVMMRIHNSDPSVTYSNSSGGWTYQGFNSNGTARTGTSLNFAFNGTSATLYSVNFGTPTSYDANTAFYSTDGNSSTNFVLPGSQSTASSGGNFSNIQNVPLFTTSNLSPAQHSLQVATSYNSSSNFPYLIATYFMIETNPANSTSPEGSSPNGSGSSDGSSSSSSSGHKSSIVGPVVGGVVGGVVLIAALILAFIFIRRRRRDSMYHEKGGMLDLSGGGTTPGNYHQSVAPPAAPYASTAAPSESYHSGTFSPNSLYQSQNPPHAVAESVAGSSTAGGTSQSGQTTSGFASMKNAQRLQMQDDQPRRSELRLHTDSGVRLPGPAEKEIIDVPPTYSEA